MAREGLRERRTARRRQRSYAKQEPVERAILAFVEPTLLSAEHEFLTKNMFQVNYKPFDWSLNDFTGRGVR